MVNILIVSALVASAPGADSVAAPKVISLEQALEIALSENTSVKVADMEIKRTGYARRGSYASLFPSLDGSASFQRTIKKQVMYMDFSIPGMESGGGGGGIEVGRWNTYSASVSSAMPLVNAQLWKSIEISGQEVELAVEKARGSRLETLTQVKQAFFACLLAREAFNVYKSVYENSFENYNLTKSRFDAQKASELELTRAKSSLEGSIPNVFDAENKVILALWQLKAVMGVDLDEDIDVAGALEDYGEQMFFDYCDNMDPDLSGNSSLRQLEIQAAELANTVKLQQYSALPSLSASFVYSKQAMTNDFKFSEYKWSPYSYAGLSLSIPIFAGGKRHNAIKQAKVQAAEVDIQRVNAERQLRIAVHQYVTTMETALKTYNASLAAVKTAQKAYDIARQSYNVGRSTITDLNDAQLALTQSKLAVSQAIYSFVIAKANLEQTIGSDINE